MNDELLSNAIRKARTNAGLSQKSLAELLGISDKTISAYELSRAIPPLHTLKRIADITKKPISFFTSDSEKNDLSIIIGKLDIIIKEMKRLKHD